MSGIRLIKAKTMVDRLRKSTRFCYILGSGASVESGIPSGNELATKWQAELKRLNEDDVANWQKELKIEINEAEPNYSAMYDLRYFDIPEEGVRYISDLMDKAEPSIGYYFLAEELTGKNNIVITTNFDNLIEKSLSIYKDVHCRVVISDEHAKYVEFPSSKPQILKPHGDAMFAPKSSRTAVDNLSTDWKEAFSEIFNYYTPIVIGYAGGDKGFMDALISMKFKKGIYWCVYGDDYTLSKTVKSFLESKNGTIVVTKGFDALMMMLANSGKFKIPQMELNEIAKGRLDRLSKAYSRFSGKLPDSDKELKDALNEFDQKVKVTEEIDKISRRIDSDAKYSDDYFDRGKQYMTLEEYEKAIADFTESILLNDSKEYSDFDNRGKALEKLKSFKEAAVDYVIACELVEGNRNVSESGKVSESDYNLLAGMYRTTADCFKNAENYVKAKEYRTKLEKLLSAHENSD